MLPTKPRTIEKIGLYRNGTKILARQDREENGEEHSYEYALMAMAALQAQMINLNRYRRDTLAETKSYKEIKAAVRKQAVRLIYWLNIYLEIHGTRDEAIEQALSKVINNAQKVDEEYVQHSLNRIVQEEY